MADFSKKLKKDKQSNAKTYIEQSIKFETIEFEAGNYHIFVEARTNRKKIRLLIDTGASKTVFDKQSIIRLLGSKPKNQTYAESIGLGTEMVRTEMIILPGLHFEKLKLKKVEVALVDLAHINDAYAMLGLKPIDGVLGCDLLVRLNANINFKTGLIRLRH